jgi:hypothetical protein
MAWLGELRKAAKSIMKHELIEHIGGDFGVTVMYMTTDEHPISVEFKAVEIVGLDEGRPTGRLYHREGSGSSEDDVSNPHEAERFVSGTVKWDGCSHVYFGDNNGYLHLCGRSSFAKLSLALPAIYERCGELMKARGSYLLDGEFKCQ